MLLETKFTHTSSSSLSASVSQERIIKLLHDFDAMMHLNPDCNGFRLKKQLSENSWEYEVEEQLTFIPKRLWSGGVTYTCTFTTLDNGCDIKVKAPFFSSTNQWRLQTIDDTADDHAVTHTGSNPGNREISITSEAVCNRTFAGITKQFVAGSHVQQQKAFADQLQKVVRPGMVKRRSSWPLHDAAATA